MKPSMTPFSSSLPRIYQVYSYYTHTPIQDHHASDMTRLIQTLTSLTTDEIPLILPLLRRIFTDIMSDPDLHTLTHTFITLWTRIALALHEEQVSQLLLPIMMELLEGSLAMKNYDPLMGICDREVCGRIFGCVGNLQFLKNFLPVLLEQLLAPQTPRDVSDRLVSALTLISSPRFLGSALTTRYILPTLTVKTGNINYKRTVSMQEYPAGPSFSLPTRRLHLSVYDESAGADARPHPPLRDVGGDFVYAVFSFSHAAIVVAHLMPKGYSLLGLVPPSSSTPTLKSIQAAMCVTEIVEVLRALLPFFSPRMIRYNLIERKPPCLADILHHLYFPMDSDDASCKTVTCFPPK